MERRQIALFAGDTSLFSVVNDIQSSDDLTVISNWAFQQKMIFNPDMTKQAQEVIFSRKSKKLLHSCLLFNGIPLKNSISQKHLGLTLDVKLNFVKHIKILLKKLVKQWAYCVDFNLSYQDYSNWPYIKQLPEVN